MSCANLTRERIRVFLWEFAIAKAGMLHILYGIYSYYIYQILSKKPPQLGQGSHERGFYGVFKEYS